MSLGLPCSCGNIVVTTPGRARQQAPCPACGKLIDVPPLGAPVGPILPHANEEDESPSRVGVWLAIGGGCALILAALVGLILWCYQGTPPDSIAASPPTAKDKEDAKQLIIPLPPGPDVT